MARAEHTPCSSWSSLPLDLAGSVSRRLPRHADHVRFAAVCRQWRASARQNPLPRQYPWLALPDRTFYSLPDSAFRPLPLHLDRHRQLPHAQSSCGEWLVFEGQDGAYTLVSPFSSATTILLPGLSDNYARKEPFRVVHDVPVPSLVKLVVCSADLVAAVIDDGWRYPYKLTLCRPGASSWSPACTHGQIYHLRDMFLYHGNLYAVDHRQGVFSISIGKDEHTGEPTVSGLDRLISSPSGLLPRSILYLLEFDGTLLLVSRESPTMDESVPRIRDNDDGDPTYIPPARGLWVEMATTFRVFEADLAREQWTELSSIGEDRVLFIGPWCSRAVAVADRDKDRCIHTGDRIFFLEDLGEEGYGGAGWYRKREPFYCSIYDMRTRRSELFLETWVRPLKGCPVTWLFPRSSHPCMDD